MIDLDCFKKINDTYGHAFGDFVIQRTAHILKASFQKENIIGRLGGDEFGVFYVGKNSRDALIRKADAALYITKKQKNRNNFTIYEENLQETDHSH